MTRHALTADAAYTRMIQRLLDIAETTEVAEYADLASYLAREIDCRRSELPLRRAKRAVRALLARRPRWLGGVTPLDLRGLTGPEP